MRHSPFETQSKDSEKIGFMIPFKRIVGKRLYATSPYLAVQLICVHKHYVRKNMDKCTTAEKNRDRVETRTAYAINDVEWFDGCGECAGLACIRAINTREDSFCAAEQCTQENRALSYAKL